MPPKIKTEWTAHNILDATGGVLACGDEASVFEGLSIDSRRISSKEFYVAIKGDTHDGHSFIEDVLSKGVAGIIADRNKKDTLSIPELEPKGIACVLVDDTTLALGRLAGYHKNRCDVSVAAVTGSNGKTTTREMMAAVVSGGFKTLSTKKNYNNNIGLPLTLLDLESVHQWAVVELGMNAPGEIKYLAGICTPDLGVITNVGPAHLEGVGSIEGVMKAKGEILGGIKTDGTAILNSDDPRVLKLGEKSPVDVLFFGLNEPARIRAGNIEPGERGSVFTLITPEDNIPVHINVPGIFMVSNALAAAAVGYKIGLNPEQIKAGLEKFTAVRGRMNILHSNRGFHMMDDTYNANPGSMIAALDTLKALKKQDRSHVVIGDMFELGEHSRSLHREIGSQAARSGITGLYVAGEFAGDVASGAVAEGMDSGDIFIGNREEIIEALKEKLHPDDWVLIKGSRAMGMEKIVEALKTWMEEQ